MQNHCLELDLVHLWLNEWTGLIRHFCKTFLKMLNLLRRILCIHVFINERISLSIIFKCINATLIK